MNNIFFNNNKYKKFLRYDPVSVSSGNFKLENFELLFFLYNSYNNFLQFNILKKKNIGLQKILNKIFPIFISKYDTLIEYIDYKVHHPFNTSIDCINNGLNYFCKINLKLNLILNFLDTSKKRISKIQNIYFINIPMMTQDGTFIINGVEKVVISKFIRSPGVFFLIKKHRKKIFYFLRLKPDKGYDLNFFLDVDNLLYLTVKNKSIFITNLFKYLGYNNYDILNKFYNFENIFVFNGIFKLKFDEKSLFNSILPYNILDKNLNIIVPINTMIDFSNLNKIKNFDINYIIIDEKYLLGKYLGEDVFNKKGNFAKIGCKIDKIILKKLKKVNSNNFKILKIVSEFHESVVLTLNKDISDFFDSNEIVNEFFEYIGFNIFNRKSFNIFNFKSDYFYKNNFDIFPICRNKLNFILKQSIICNNDYLTANDLFGITKLLISFKEGIFKEDDLNNLNNLNLQLVGNIIEDIIYDSLFFLKYTLFKGFISLKKDYLTLLPKDFLNFKPLDIALKKFFNISKYCQFLDQINILSEISHKRRLSFLDVKGISRKHSGFNVRDLNSSYYSRLCPVETPEGINIGLISSLALLCGIDNYGNLVAPYYKVNNFKIKNKIKYLILREEFNNVITDANNRLFKNNLKKGFVNSRYNEKLINIDSSFINYIDIKPYQILSISASIIPFIEHNDSNRALMASNMLRQSLPCLFPQRPFIGTGLEKLIGISSNTVIVSKYDGIVMFSDSNLIIIKRLLNYKNFYLNFFDIYFLFNYKRSNQNTNISQRSVVKYKDKVTSGDIIADGSCTDYGELSLGQNMLVAFMCYEGYNFEDSVIVSEKVVNDDRYTSLTLTQVDVSIYNTDNGPEVLTKFIYNTHDLNLDDLDDNGVVKLGSIISGGGILVGKITPSSNFNDEISPETRFLKSVFSEKINEIDSSFYLPLNFLTSTITNIEYFFSNNFSISSLDEEILKNQITKILYDKNKKINYFLKKIKYELKNFLIGQKFESNKFLNLKDSFKEYIKFEHIKYFGIKELFSFKLLDFNLNFLFKKIKLKFKKFYKSYKDYKNYLNEFKYKKNLPVNVIKIIRFTIITKKKLQVGDKMSGRHGNKGVISKILPINQMPYLSNGKIIDIILNPLGVPSRMNIGQILEVHLGLASFFLGLKISNMLKFNDIFNLKNLIYKIYKKNYFDYNLNDDEVIFLSKFLKNGIYFAIPPFSNFKEADINYLLDLAFDKVDIDISYNKKQFYLYDGISGKKFDKPVTVGIMYFFKLNHLVSDKIHARSVGPYSLVTQQPLKGRSSFGGQRVGEMEVWALEAYGATHTLQEMLTIKSDDVVGRFNAYKNIINDNFNFSFNRPECFDIMMSNINSLNLFISFRED